MAAIEGIEYNVSIVLQFQSMADTPPPQTSNLQIDWEHLHQLSDNSPEFELDLLELFTEDTQAHLKTLAAAIASSDFPQIKRLAHHIKGAAANVGIETIRAIANQIEEQAHQQAIPGASTHQQQLEQSLQDVRNLVAAAKP